MSFIIILFIFASNIKTTDMNISSNSLVKEVVKQNFKTAPLFQVNNIDYCCGGDKTISDACKETGINQELLIKKLEAIIGLKDPDSEYMDTLMLGDLVDYIVKRHHSYVNESIPVLKQNLKNLPGTWRASS